jgi:antitoxin ParD1/3/4
MPTSVALSPYFETFVKEQVSACRFNNVSEVVRAGLRLLEEQEQSNALRLQELRNAIQAGTVSGPGLESSTVFERLESKYKAMTHLSSTDSAS